MGGIPSSRDSGKIRIPINRYHLKLARSPDEAQRNPGFIRLTLGKQFH